MRRELSIHQTKRVPSGWVCRWRVAAALVLALAGSAGATNRQVPQQYPTIQAAVDAALDGDDVVISAGTYTGAGNCDIEVGAKSIWIRSTCPDSDSVVANTVIDCQGTAEAPHRAFSCRVRAAEKVVNFYGLTIINGYGPAETVSEFDHDAYQTSVGGAILTHQEAAIIHCVFRNNRANLGGAVFCGTGGIPIYRCTLDGNISESRGGAVYAQQYGDFRVWGCTFTGNEARTGEGGAIFAYSCPLELDGTLFQENAATAGGAHHCRATNTTVLECQYVKNRATIKGGAVSLSANSWTDFAACSFVGNSATGDWDGQGGAVSNEGSPAAFKSCLLAGNAAGSVGGAVCTINDDYSVQTQPVRLLCCTLTGNTAGSAGGAVGISSTYAGELYANSSVFWGNTAPGGSQVTLDGMISGKFLSCDVQGGPGDVQKLNGNAITWDGEGNLDVDPLFADADGPDNDPGTAVDNDYHLAAASPCIDAGRAQSSIGAIGTDVEGYARFYDEPSRPDTGIGTKPLADMGAYEFGSGPLIVAASATPYVVEGSTRRLEVWLSAMPAANVTVTATIVSGDPDITIVSGSVMTFTPANYSTYQYLELAAAEDADKVEDCTIVRLSAPGLAPVDVRAYELENDLVLIETDTDTVSVPENGTATFNVRLSARPRWTTEIDISRYSGDSSISVQGSLLLFTTSNWSTWQTVTLAAAADADAVNGQTTIRCDAYELSAHDVTATEIDDDKLEIATDRTLVNVPEGGTSTFKVKLTAQPTASVQVNVSRLSGDTDISLQSGAVLTFTTANWSTYQAVTLAAAEDADAANSEATFQCSAEGLAAQTIAVRESDNDSLQILADTQLVNVPEGGTSTFQVKLSAQPVADLQVSVARVGGDADISVQSGAVLTFAASNWNTYQTVTLAAAEDADMANGEAVILCSAGDVGSREVVAREVENESPGIVVDRLAVNIAEGGTSTFKVKLAGQPAGDVQVSVSRFGGDTDISVQSGAILTFTTVNWSTYQTVTLAAAEDLDAASGEASIQCSAAGTDPVMVSAHEIDNDTLLIGLGNTFVWLPEGGTGTFTVRLTAKPMADVQVNITKASGDEDIFVLSGATLTFTDANWNAYQTVTLAAAEDADMTAGQAMFFCTAEGLPQAEAYAKEIDNDVPAIVADRAAVQIPEGGTATFGVKLTAQPMNDTEVHIAKLSGGDGSISVQYGATLTFTAANWGTYQTVTLAAGEDGDALDGQATIRCSATDLENLDITAQEMDNDKPVILVDPAVVDVLEGGTGTLKVRLSGQPASNTLVNIAWLSGDTSITVQSGAALTFTAANWSVYQTVTLAAAEDTDAVSGEATIRCGAAGMASVDVTAREIDNDACVVVVDSSSVSVPEGGTATFQVKLSAPPSGSAQVSVVRASGDASISVTGGASLTFTSSNWNTYKAVTLAAAEDADSADGEAVIRCDAIGLTAAEVTAHEVDNDVLALGLEQDQVSVPEGSMATFRVKLLAQPGETVKVDVGRASGDADISVQTGAVLTFTTANWNAYQTVILAAAEDADVGNGEAVIRCSSDGMASRDVVAHEVDNDTLGLVTDVGSVSVPEGSTGTFQVKLNAQPAGNVQINVSRASGDADLSVASGAMLTFTPADWSTYQTVTLAAAEDADVGNGEAVIRCSATGQAVAEVTAHEVDNDILRIVSEAGSVVVPEGGTVGFGVRLSAPVTGSLTVSVARKSGDTDVAVQGGASLVFTAGNWNVYQTVTLSAAQDADNASGQATIRCSASGAVGCEVLATEQDNWVNLTAPVVTITAPTDGANWVVGEGAVSLGGEASDDGGVVEVVWANDRGGSGLCAGTTVWTAAGIPLAEGQNVITITARDAVNQVGTDTLVVTLDRSAPVVQVLSQSQSGGTLTLTGTASDNQQVVEVSWTNSRGGSGVCSGTTDWSVAGIVLATGQNVITVAARDGLGHVGSSTVAVTYNPVNEVPGGETPGGETPGGETPGGEEDPGAQVKPAAPGCGAGATSAMMAGLVGLSTLRGGWRRRRGSAECGVRSAE